MFNIFSKSRVQRVRHELKRRELQVLRTAQLSPGVRSITFGSPDLADFVSASFDDHLKLFVPSGAGGAVVGRDYTPRYYDRAACELTIEFSLHGDGPAATWAAQAAPGQRVGIGGPRGSFVVPMDYAWHLLIGDDTGLPAIARRLEELPAGAKAIVIVQVEDAADRRELKTAAALTLHWVSTSDELLAATQALSLPPGDGYAWCAAEARVSAGLRRMLVDEKGHDRHAIRASAYWKQGAAGHHEDL